MPGKKKLIQISTSTIYQRYKLANCWGYGNFIFSVVWLMFPVLLD